MSGFIGLDLGTSALKALLVGEDETVLAEAEVPLVTARPRPGWSEQNPDDWWAATETAMRVLRRAARDAWANVAGIGLSGQMHGAVCLDAQDRVLRPAILWNDARSEAECRVLAARVPELERIAGAIAMPGFAAPKMLWLRASEPETFAATARFLLPKDVIRLRLTGEHATDMCDAAGSLLLDEARRDWSDTIVEACGLTRRRLPRLVEGSSGTGRLRREIAQRFGLPRHVTVAGGAGDIAAAAIGLGAIENGDAFLSLGTSGQIFVGSERYDPKPGRMLHHFAHALPGRWFKMAAMLNGGSSLAWLAAILGGTDPAVLIAEAEAGRRGPDGPIFLPYLAGERTPHNDPNARGAFVGIDSGTRRGELVAAVLEGTAFGFAEGKAALETGSDHLTWLVAVGGGARSAFWMQMFADVLDCPILRVQGSQGGPALGAARLARLAVTGEAAPSVCRPPAIVGEHVPDTCAVARYGERFARFRAAYAALKA